jgi:hypothetical protein
LTKGVRVRPSNPLHPAHRRYQRDFLHPLPHFRTFLLRCQPPLHHCPPLYQPLSNGRIHLQWCLHHRRLFIKHRNTHATTLPRRSSRFISPRQPGSISLQAIHHVMRIEADKVATGSQWTGYCCGVVYPITKETITQYRKLQHDPDLQLTWIPAMSKEIHRLAQGKAGITKGTDTIFFLSHSAIQTIPSDRTVTYA